MKPRHWIMIAWIFSITLVGTFGREGAEAALTLLGFVGAIGAIYFVWRN